MRRMGGRHFGLALALLYPTCANRAAGYEAHGWAPFWFSLGSSPAGSCGILPYISPVQDKIKGKHLLAFHLVIQKVCLRKP